MLGDGGGIVGTDSSKANKRLLLSVKIRNRTNFNVLIQVPPCKLPFEFSEAEAEADVSSA